MIQWTLYPIKLPLKFTWKISRGEVSEKENFIIKAREDNEFALGEVALQTNSPGQDRILKIFEGLPQKEMQSLEDLFALKIPEPLRFGLTSAWTHLQAKQKQLCVSEYLNQKPILPIRTSFSLPILTASEREKYIKDHDLQRFSALKVKIAPDNPTQPCLDTYKLTQKPLRIDANQSFQSVEEVLTWMKTIQGIEVEFIEQPLPKEMVNESIELKKQSPFLIFGDESVTDQIDPELWKKQFHGINLKLMKSGSYQKLLAQREAAKEAGLKTMIGCMIESSLATSCALHIAQDFDYYDLDSSLFIKSDPYCLVEESSGGLNLQTLTE